MKYSINVAPNTRGNLQMMVRYKMKRKYISLGYTIDREKWNSDTQRCVRNTTHGDKKVMASTINAAIEHHYSLVESVAAQLPHIPVPTPDDFFSAIDQALNPSSSHAPANLFQLYQQFINEQSREASWTSGTITKHRTILRQLRDFNPSLQFSDLDEQGINHWCDYLLSIGIRNTTIKKDVAILKWFLRWAVAKGHTTDTAFVAYRNKLKTTPKRVIFLTWDELTSLYHLPIPESKAYLQRVRDIFCFQCFTSLRFSDVAHLRKDNIVNDIIHITTIKTNDPLRIELNDYSRTLLNRYAHTDSPLAFPVITNQKMNTYLKELGQLAQLNSPITETYYVGRERRESTKPKWQHLTTHCGRRTFICNALMLGIQPDVVMKWTGHSDYKSMKPYIDVADSTKKTAMALFNK